MLQLDALVEIGSLAAEPPDRDEFECLVTSGRRQLQDASVKGLSDESKFQLAYGAAHSLAVAALRWHGYRSRNRYLVFQCLEHSVGLKKEKWRVLDACHRQRNLAEYQGHMDITAQLLSDLVRIAAELLKLVESMGAP
ncbi:MAG: hypothetical protein RLP02_05030 [Coleofasciculus sp. C2-GNP5-27]